MPNPLTKMALRAADLLSYLEAKQAQTETTIQFLKGLLTEAGVAHNFNGNGHHKPAQRTPEAIVAKAQAMFEARPKVARKGSKRPRVFLQEHVAQVVALLQRHGPMGPRDIKAAIGTKSTTAHFGYLREAMSQKLVEKRMDDEGRPIYAATGRGPNAKKAKAARKKGRHGGPRPNSGRHTQFTAEERIAQIKALLAKNGPMNAQTLKTKLGYSKASGEVYHHVKAAVKRGDLTAETAPRDGGGRAITLYNLA